MINNNVLGVLVVFAIIASLGAATFTYNTLSQVQTVGSATGITTLNLQGDAIITLVNDNVDFGTVNLGSSEDTEDDIPVPFIVQNDGNVNVDVTIEADDLWAQAPNPSSYFQFHCGDSGLTVCGIGSPTIWTDIPENGMPILAISNLDYQSGSDTLEVEVRIEVPDDEVPGVKSSVVTLTPSEAL